VPRLGGSRLGRSRLVLVDGPSGAGKTMYAQELAVVLGPDVEVVHTDDLLDGWDDQFTYWERLERQVLAPLRRGEPGRYQRYDWHAGAFDPEWITVEPAAVVIIEGVGAARAEGRRWASLTVYVDAAPAVCQARTLARDGADVEPYLRIWRKREAEHFGADATARHTDLVIAGDRLDQDGGRGP
jgi:uridine kinase